MKSKEQLVSDAFYIANQTIATTTQHIYVAFEKGEILADYYKADKQIVMIGLYLMDIKLKEERKLGRKKEHISMASQFAKEFLKDYDISKDEYDKIINCIEAHHKDIPFSCIEAEICANADCYRFIYPTGVFAYESFLSGKMDNIEDIIAKMKSKLEEKYQIISLDKTKEDLEENYQMFVKMFNTILYKENKHEKQQ